MTGGKRKYLLSAELQDCMDSASQNFSSATPADDDLKDGTANLGYFRLVDT